MQSYHSYCDIPNHTIDISFGTFLPRVPEIGNAGGWLWVVVSGSSGRAPVLHGGGVGCGPSAVLVPHQGHHVG